MKMWRSKYVAAGVRTDSDKLLQKFVENDVIEYKEFAKFWKEMNFSIIFMGRRSSKDLNELQAECFRIAKMYWDPKYCLAYCVGGFFLLYGFYKKQLTKPPQRIRMQMEEWRFVINLMQICKEKKMYDVNYLFYTLCKENAFHFVYNSKMFGPKISLSDTNVVEQEARWKEILMPMNSLSYNGELDQISTIHEKYQKLKESFEPSTSNSLSLIKSNVADDALHEIKKFLENNNETVYKTKVNKTNDKNNEEEREQESEEENIGRHRADLKEKGFFRDLSISRTRRSVLEIEDKETSKKSRLSYEKDT